MHSFAWWPTLIVLGVATFTDLRSRRIPNWLVLPFLVAGIAVSGWFHGWHGVGQSLAGVALGTLIYGFLFWMGGMGAGDVKLCAWFRSDGLYDIATSQAAAGKGKQHNKAQGRVCCVVFTLHCMVSFPPD